jgi:hypothetical protein
MMPDDTTISVSVPLFIRLLEYAREDAKDDLSLHDIAEHAIRLHRLGIEVLDMHNYDELVATETHHEEQ